MNSSVKFLSPMTIGGLPLPGWAPPPEDEEPEPEDPPDPPLAEEDDDELPQAANATPAIRTAPPRSARLRIECIFSPSEVANCKRMWLERSAPRRLTRPR